MALPGWYPNPWSGGGLRYWDGQHWTARTMKAGGGWADSPYAELPPLPGGEQRGPRTGWEIFAMVLAGLAVLAGSPSWRSPSFS